MISDGNSALVVIHLQQYSLCSHHYLTQVPTVSWVIHKYSGLSAHKSLDVLHSDILSNCVLKRLDLTMGAIYLSGSSRKAECNLLCTECHKIIGYLKL